MCMCISAHPRSKNKYEVTEGHCQVGLRVEVSILDTNGEGNCNKEGAVGTLP